MCNINIILNKKGKKSIEIVNLMNVISENSFISNNEGEGFFMKNGSQYAFNKSKTKIIYKGLCDLLISHQRIATSGNNFKNIQPFHKDGYLIFHNGIFYGKGNNNKSDTNKYFRMLLKEIKKEEGNIIKAIQNISQKVNGSYSIVIVDLNNNKYYYYKNDLTSFYKLESKNWLIYSTNKENCLYAKQYLNLKDSVYSVKENVIYDLLTFQKIASFKPKSYINESKSINFYENYNHNENNWFWNSKNNFKERNLNSIRNKLNNEENNQKTLIFDSNIKKIEEKPEEPGKPELIINEYEKEEIIRARETALKILEEKGFFILDINKYSEIRARIPEELFNQYKENFKRYYKDNGFYVVVFALNSFEFMFNLDSNNFYGE